MRAGVCAAGGAGDAGPPASSAHANVALAPFILDAGFGNHLARPLMREKHRPDMSEEEATALMHECLKARQAATCLCTGW